MFKDTHDFTELAANIKKWGHELGFQEVGIADIELDEAEAHLLGWLAAGYHGEMSYMARHGKRRSRPADLVDGCIRVISARMDYLPEPRDRMISALDKADQAYLSRYALGRDYHKIMRSRLQKLANRIATLIGPFGYRVFSDSAPVLEKALAAKAGLGWIGKHTNLINRQSGSWFFLGEIYVDLPLPTDDPVENHCGSCSACLDICPTQAIIAPYQLDARRCVSYLTIELHGAIPVEFRSKIGNRIYGCDDCQIVCPWNRFAQLTTESDFLPRGGLDSELLISLFRWDEATFLARTEGSAIRRIGYQRWLRNLAIGLGNARPSQTVLDALKDRLEEPSDVVLEHIHWAIEAQVSATK